MLLTHQHCPRHAAGRHPPQVGSLTHALHRAAYLGRHPEELAEVPPGDLHHTVVQTGLKVSCGGVGHRVPGEK